jgi:murein L,D-transpeptidase YafK
MRILRAGGICALCLLGWVGPLTLAHAQASGIDQLVLYKSAHKLVALTQGQVVRSYQVALGKTPRGAKLCRGDNRTPEGAYFVSRRVPGSHYYLALHLSYPSDDDVVRARDLGCDPGGDVEIHGLTRGYEWVGERHREHDWTNGCIALTNREITELYRLVAVGTPVHIYP